MINFLKYKWLYFLISALVIGVGLFSIFRYGFKLSIDFVGGSLIEYRSGGREFLLKTAPVEEKNIEEIKKQLEKEKKTKIDIRRFETVGPTLGKETIRKTITASVVAIFGILVYLTFAFRNVKYGLAAILAMIHDFLVVVGSYSLLSKFLGAEVDTLFVTALLTTMSFSVHDTIVVFDKIREYRRLDSVTPFNILANKALTETIVRSLNNSLTIILMLLALVLLGGETIRFFAATLLIGTITGTYSSPFVATPVLQMLERRKRK